MCYCTFSIQETVLKKKNVPKTFSMLKFMKTGHNISRAIASPILIDIDLQLEVSNHANMFIRPQGK